MSVAVSGHKQDLLKFDNGMEIPRWESKADFYNALSEKYTVTSFAEVTDMTVVPVDDVDAHVAAEMFEDYPYVDKDEDEMLECYEIDF